MKLFHLSDLHIGKVVNGYSMEEEQQYVLQQVIHYAQKYHPDAILIAGDVYDKAIPSLRAVQILDNFLTSLVKMKVPVLMISGNHDGAQRLSFGSELFKEQNLFISKTFDGSVEKVSLEDEEGIVDFYLLPFIKPSTVQPYSKETIATYDEAISQVISHLPLDVHRRNVLLAHQMVTGAAPCDSEEMLIGGVENISAEHFGVFDYVALGHIHSPQSVGRKEVRYCGTLLKYSFSEAHQEKSISLVTLGKKGEVFVEVLPVKPIHDMTKIKGTYEEVTRLAEGERYVSEDYVQITLTDEVEQVDVAQKLREFYPQLMQLQYDNLRTKTDQEMQKIAQVEQKTPLELLEEFYQLQNNQPMSEEQKSWVVALLQKGEQ